MYSWHANVTLLLLAATHQGRSLTDDVDPLFSAGEYRFTGGRYKDEPFHYRLFQPVDPQPGRTYPLVIWLHGYGDYEFDVPNEGQLIHSELVFLRKDIDICDQQFFVLAMQLPRSRPNWFDEDRSAQFRSSSHKSDEPGEVVMELVASLICSLPIDPDAVTALGISGGGGSCWELAMRHPDMLAAIAPIAGGGGDVARVSRMADVAVWAYHMQEDPVTPIHNVMKTIAAHQAAGGDSHLTALEGQDHNAWTQALGQHDVLRWLITRRRGGAGIPPGYDTQETWILVLEAVIVAVLLWAIITEMRRRALAR